MMDENGMADLHGKRILLLGEGNFSFASRFLEAILSTGARPEAFVATAFSSRPNGTDYTTGESANKIVSSGGQVLHGIDATNLSNHCPPLEPPFDLVIFNFPHVGGKMRLNKNRALLAGFLSSASGVLRKCEAKTGHMPEIWVSLCGGQGGTEWDEPKRAWNDTWQLPLIAARCRLMLRKVVPFPSHYLPYNQTGYRGLDKRFLLGKALTHVLIPMKPCILSEGFPPWVPWILDEDLLVEKTKASCCEEFLQSCVGCDSSLFEDIIRGSDITGFLENFLSRFGHVSVISEPVIGDAQLKNHPPLSVFLEIECESPLNTSFILSDCSSALKSRFDLRHDLVFDMIPISKELNSCKKLRINLVELFARTFKLSSWSEIFCLEPNEPFSLSVNLGALTFVHHLSVWTDVSFDEFLFLKTLFERFSLVIAEIRVLEKEYVCPSSNRSSRLFEFKYRCSAFPFSDEACKRFHTLLLPRFLDGFMKVVVR